MARVCVEDFIFHLAVAHASDNQIFVSAIASIREQMFVTMTLMRNPSLIKHVRDVKTQ